MLFNRWHKFPNRKPKISGWYQCTCQHAGGTDVPAVMDLFYDQIYDAWIDYRRLHVFNGYKVYEACKPPIDDFRKYSDGECERIDILAWKKLPKCYGKKWRSR